MKMNVIKKFIVNRNNTIAKVNIKQTQYGETHMGLRQTCILCCPAWLLAVAAYKVPFNMLAVMHMVLLGAKVERWIV